jgi:hypothetical protein
VVGGAVVANGAGAVSTTPGGPPTDLPRWPSVAAVDLGRVIPGTNGGGSTRFVAPSDGTVQASLPAGSPFAVSAIETYKVSRQLDTYDPSELGPGHRGGGPVRSWSSVLTPDTRTDGAGPVSVPGGELVQIDLVDVAAQTQAAATLTITTSWGTVQAPVTVFVGQVKASIDNTNLSVPQGRSVDLPVTVTSLGGPDTDVSFSAGDPVPGIDLTNPGVHVPGGQTVHANLHFQVSRDAPVGPHDYHLALTAYADAGQADEQSSGIGDFDLTVTPLPVLSTSVNLGDIKSTWDGARDQACEVIKDQIGQQVDRLVGHTIRDPECSLSPLQLSASQQGSTITLDAAAIGNRIGFHVTTPDGFPADWDPYFFLFFDVHATLTVTLPTSLQGTPQIRVDNVDVSLWSKDGLQSEGVTGDLVQYVATLFGYGQLFQPIKVGLGDQSQQIVDRANQALGTFDPLFAAAGQKLGFTKIDTQLDPNSLVLTLTIS